MEGWHLHSTAQQLIGELLAVLLGFLHVKTQQCSTVRVFMLLHTAQEPQVEP